MPSGARGHRHWGASWHPPPLRTLALIADAGLGLLAPRTGPGWAGEALRRGDEHSPLRSRAPERLQRGCHGPQSCLLAVRHRRGAGRLGRGFGLCCVCVSVQAGRRREHSLIHQLTRPVSRSEAPVAMFNLGSKVGTELTWFPLPWTSHSTEGDGNDLKVTTEDTKALMLLGCEGGLQADFATGDFLPYQIPIRVPLRVPGARFRHHCWDTGERGAVRCQVAVSGRGTWQSHLRWTVSGMTGWVIQAPTDGQLDPGPAWCQT